MDPGETGGLRCSRCGGVVQGTRHTRTGYPVAPAKLAQSVRELLAAGGSPRPGVVAVVVPHAAYQYSGPTAAHGFAAAGAGVRRAIVLAPSHFAHFRGAALLPMSGYRTP